MKLILDDLSAVPEALRSEYVEKDGKFRLRIEGDTERATLEGKLNEFRSNNIAYLKELEELRGIKTKFEGVDPEAAKAAFAKLSALENKGVKSADDIDARLKAALEAVVNPLRAELAEVKNERTQAREELSKSALRDAVSKTFLQNGGKAKALDFIVGKAEADGFRADGGAIKAAANKFSADRPGEPLSLDEWIGSQIKENDFAFEPSKGGGAAPSNGSGVRTGVKQLVNPTMQELGRFSKEIAEGKIQVVSQ
jgi:hypothetical protein